MIKSPDLRSLYHGQYRGADIEGIRCVWGAEGWREDGTADHGAHGPCRHGQGTLRWPNGDMYTGDFRNGMREGQGTLTCASGRKSVEGARGGTAPRPHAAVARRAPRPCCETDTQGSGGLASGMGRAPRRGERPTSMSASFGATAFMGRAASSRRAGATKARSSTASRTGRGRCDGRRGTCTTASGTAAACTGTAGTPSGTARSTRASGRNTSAKGWARRCSPTGSSTSENGWATRNTGTGPTSGPPASRGRCATPPAGRAPAPPAQRPGAPAQGLWEHGKRLRWLTEERFGADGSRLRMRAPKDARQEDAPTVVQA